MTTSKTIAALLGPTLVATAAMVLVNLDAMPTIIEELSKNPMLIVLAGHGRRPRVLAIIYFHNRWTGGWPVLITLVGWLSLVIGLIRMVFRCSCRNHGEGRPRHDRRPACDRHRLPVDRRVSVVRGLRS